MSDNLREQFDAYISDLFAREDDALRWIQAETVRNALPAISVRAVEGHLLGWLTRLVGARIAVEIGVLGGYSGTWIARSLPEDGRLYAVEKVEKHAAVARAAFDYAGVGDRVELLQGDAMDVLKGLGEKGPFDLVFIDADKESYPVYLDWAADNVRSGGLVVAHNAYQQGAVLEPQSESNRAMDSFNRAMASDPRLDGMILPLYDGMAVARRR